LYREGLAVFLEREPGLQVVGSAASASEAMPTMDAAQPDVLLVDLVLEEGSAVRQLAARACVPAVVLGIDNQETAILSWAETGIAGFVTKEGSLSDLVAAIRGAARGEFVCSPRLAFGMLRRLTTLATQSHGTVATSRLTSRERQIVDLIAGDLSNKEIAGRLGVTLSTVKNHVHNVLDKLGVSHRHEAAAAMGGWHADQVVAIKAQADTMTI
jgi:DNA-binding NarL/FixJ family response regulator